MPVGVVEGKGRRSLPLGDSVSVDRAIELIAAAAQTGEIGDGKIWAIDPDRLQRVRTGEVGEDAV